MRHTVKGIAFSLFASFCLLAVCGCNTLPNGWDTASPDEVGQLSLVIRDILSGKVSVDTELKLCIAESGIVGGIDFWRSQDSGEDVKVRLLDSVNTARDHAEKYYPALCKQYGGLDGIVLRAVLQALKDSDTTWVRERSTQAEFLISLIHSVVSNDFLDGIVQFDAGDEVKLGRDLVGVDVRNAV